MNERIRELLVEAREQTKEGSWNAPTAVWAEKFAELIVRKCAGLCSATAAGRDAEAIEEAILKHFGVEE